MDPRPPTLKHSNTPTLLFDGVCNLCQGAVQWVLLHDRAGRFRFASLQSDTGKALLKKYGLQDDRLDSIVLVDGDRAYTHSAAVLQTARLIGGIWSVFSIFRFLPRRWRDRMYNWVARNRYRWFGREEACWLPRPEWKERFL